MFLLVIFFELLFVFNSFSLEITPIGNIRYRFELWDGLNQKNFGDPNSFGKLKDKILLQRYIFGFESKLAPKTTFTFAIQDSRAFGWSLNSNDFKIGNPTNYYVMNPQEEFFDFYAFYLSYDSIFENAKITFGRQKISFGDSRVFGPGEWGNTGRWTWDAIKLVWSNKKNFVVFWGGGTKIHDPKVTSIPFFNTEFYGACFYSSFVLDSFFRVEPFFASKFPGSAKFIKEKKFNLSWIGVRLVDSNLANFNFDFTYSYQFGKKETVDVQAFGLFAKLGYNFFDLIAKPSLSFRFTYASGGLNSNGSIAKFEPIYGANDKYYGWMNIVSWSNIVNPEIVLELFPMKNFFIETKYNFFYVNDRNEKILGLTVGPSKHLGDEFDVFVNYFLVKNLSFTTVFGIFFPKDSYLTNLNKPKNAFYFALQIMYDFLKK